MWKHSQWFSFCIFCLFFDLCFFACLIMKVNFLVCQIQLNCMSQITAATAMQNCISVTGSNILDIYIATIFLSLAQLTLFFFYKTSWKVFSSSATLKEIPITNLTHFKILIQLFVKINWKVQFLICYKRNFCLIIFKATNTKPRKLERIKQNICSSLNP